MESYRAGWKRLTPSLGSLRLQSLTPLAIQTAFDALRGTHAPKSIRVSYSVLHNPLGQAVKWEILTRNPSSRMVLPPANPRAQRQVWSVTEARQFLAKTEDHDWHSLWRLLLDTRMRHGEALSLRWQHVDIDSDRPLIRIVCTLMHEHGTWAIGTSTKSERGRRVVHLRPATAAALRVHRDNQTARQAQFGPHWADHDLVFDRGDGGIFHPAKVRDSLISGCVQAGVPKISPHALRHTMATPAAQRGVPLKLLADRLGYPGADLVSTLYAHATDDGDLAVLEAMRDVL